MAKIIVQNTNITIINVDGEDYVSITDLARHKSDDPTAVICNWMRNRNTIEFLGIWESLYNPDFKPLEFEGFRKEAGLNAFTLSPKKWIETPMLSVWFPNPDATEVLMPIKILRSNSQVGLPLSFNFKMAEFDHFRMSAGLPSFVMSTSEWIERTDALALSAQSMSLWKGQNYCYRLHF